MILEGFLMSLNQAQHFLTKVLGDAQLTQLLKSIPDYDARYALACQLGYDFTPLELEKALLIKMSKL